MAKSGGSVERNRGGSPGAMPRRAFLQGAAGAAAFGMISRRALGAEGHVPASERTTLACIGTGGQGVQNLTALIEFPEMQVVAVCDVVKESGDYQSWNWGAGKERRPGGREPARQLVDDYYAKNAAPGGYKGCRAYADYRELLEKEDVDAVMIATPDHTHAVIAMDALKRGKHVYCEKPLTYSVYEARQVTEAARKAGVATQLGNHGQATEEARVTCEMIWSGAIGPVHEVEFCHGSRFWHYPSFQGRPTDTPPVPDGLDWDLWLGPAPERPYHPEYCPWTWRNWLDFGTGLIGDLGCHKLSTVFKALKLTHPVSVEASSSGFGPELYPLASIIRYEFPARGDMPPVKLTWYDGGLKPPRPDDLEPGRRSGGDIYHGENGTMLGYRLIPEARMKEYGTPPEMLPRSVGHYKEWVDACRGGAPAGADFVQHAGLLTETPLLGNVALRAGTKLQWDGPNLKITNDESANQYLHREYRDGWSL
ncbi:MAG: Gfo/Idh/MocA family oxidoreductase [Candidatus Hydrogenedentes bacterium]|nr:Gfo/Idh/MocA family oxidoreductase [Candidatus Hydrogenedentota bacterium]